jgi:hypothetical protein
MLITNISDNATTSVESDLNVISVLLWILDIIDLGLDDSKVVSRACSETYLVESLLSDSVVNEEFGVEIVEETSKLLFNLNLSHVNEDCVLLGHDSHRASKIFAFGQTNESICARHFYQKGK